MEYVGYDNKGRTKQMTRFDQLVAVGVLLTVYVSMTLNTF